MMSEIKTEDHGLLLVGDPRVVSSSIDLAINI